MVGSLRRTTSVPSSGGEENLSSRRRTVTGSGSDNDSKNKQDPLPDILHDWEIIVKSLRGDENQCDSSVEITKISKPKLVKSPKKITTPKTLSISWASKIEPINSDKEDSQLKKRKSIEAKAAEIKSPETKLSDSKLSSEGDYQEFATPSTSAYLFSPGSSRKNVKCQSDGSPHDESDTNWRRPTRSTYKAFETIFDSPELEDIPLKCELNGGDPKEIEALRALFTPKKEDKSENTLSIVNKGNNKKVLKRLSKFPIKPKLLSKGKQWRKPLTRNNDLKLRKRGRPRKIKLSENLKEKIKKSIKEKRITRGSLITKKSSYSNESTFRNKTQCKELIVKIENLKFPCSPEMDFIGFGATPSPSKKLPVSVEPHKEIIAQESLDLTSEESDHSVEFEKEILKEICFSPKTSPIKETLVEKSSPVKLGTSTKKENSLDSSALLEFEALFGKDQLTSNNFEGFNSSFSDKKTCLKCHLIVDDSLTLKHHIKTGHKKVYPCPFDVGECGRSRGSVDFHNHLFSTHTPLVSFLEEHLNTDILGGKVTHFMNNKVGCSVCLMHLDQPMRCIHEILVHGIWPPSILNLSPVAIDQHVSLWWTGRNLAFACHLCHSPENSTFTIPIISSAPHCFPTLLSNHLRNVHLLNVPLLQGWFLMFKLLLSLSAFPRRTLATMISLGVDTKTYYANCLICDSRLKMYANMNLNLPGCMCKKCDYLCRTGMHCWYGCKSIPFNESVLEHIIIHHNDKSVEGWCVTCGSWTTNLLLHLNRCTSVKPMCRLCLTVKVSDMSILNKAWHSLSAHSYFCPVPTCCDTKHSNDLQFFSSCKTLLNHLLTQHLPEWNRMGLEQISSMIFGSKKNHGFVLTAPMAMQLNGTWIGVSGHHYYLQGTILSPKEAVKVSLICLLCSREWDETVAYTCKEGGAVCSECTLVLSQCEGRRSIRQCPVSRCMEKITSMHELCQHLTDMHKLTPLPKKSSCSYCGPVSLESPLSAIIHNVMKHKIACLLCPFTAPTSAQIFAHRATMHGLPSWDAVFQHLKVEEKSRSKKKPDLLDGIVRVWDNAEGTYSLWDQSMKFSDLLKNEQEEEDRGVINQSVQESYVEAGGALQETTMVNQWCSSICSVSMSSPSKPPFDTMSVENDIKPELTEIMDNQKCTENSSLVVQAPIENDNYSDYSDDSDDQEALEIDSGALSDGSKEVKEENTYSVTIPVDVPVTNSTKKSLKYQRNASSKTPSSGLVDALNTVMEESINSMTQALSTNGNGNSKQNGTTKQQNNSHIKHKKGDNSKGLGENACFDEKSMAENILKDLEDKYCATCVGCGNSVQLSHLKVHMKTIHPGKTVHCSCGYIAELYDALVHSFHMSHIPNEARPIVFKAPGGGDQSMIVLEARSDLKTMTYPCYKCFKRFKQEKSRQLHYNLCKLEKKFDCDVCGEKFALDNHLQKHKEWKHNPQVCKHCGKTFNSSSSLAQHVLHIHKKPLSQRCKQCGDAFNTSKQLKVHLRIHSGIQPHACKSCSSTFISRNLLRKHVAKNHERLSKERSFNLKMNGVSSSSDSSDSDDSDSDTRRKNKRTNDDMNKVIALTESDLNTSSSEIYESPPKKMKATSASNKKIIIKEPSTPNDSKNSKAGIYQDQGIISLPEIRSNIRNKVESTVGRMCAPCSQEFESATAKLLHMYLIHPGIVLTLGFNECSFCHHKFSSADDVSNHHLDKHQRTSLANGNFRCLCGLVFREDGAYYFHLYYAHKAQRALNIGGEIVCRVCDGRPRLNKIVDLVVHLSDRHTMFDHVRFNDSYMCNFCYKAFESWTVLSLHFFMVHKATKSQTLSYDCPFCQGASPWHSLEALQYHLDNVHRGRHTQSRPVPEHSRSIYTPAPAPSSPTKKKEIKESTPMKSKRVRKPQKQKSKNTQQQVLYCLCRVPYDERSDMIGCDNDDCKFQWFHFECVGIMAAPEGNWFCPNCKNEKEEKQKQSEKQQDFPTDLYDYYSNYSNDAAKERPNNRSRNHSSSSSSSSNSSSSSSSNSSSSSSSSSGDSSSGSGEEN